MKKNIFFLFSVHSDNCDIIKTNPHSKQNSLEVKENSPKKGSYCGSDTSDLASHVKRDAPPYKEPPAPPPYRDPPPPNAAIDSKYKKSLINEFSKPINKNDEGLFNSQYRELIHLVNYQRDKLSALQADLTKVTVFYLLLYKA